MASEGDSIDSSKRYGWWSEAHRPYTHRLLVYMNDQGKEVTLTGVTSTSNRKGYGWKDAEARGELSHLVRVIQTNKPKPTPTSQLRKVKKPDPATIPG